MEENEEEKTAENEEPGTGGAADSSAEQKQAKDSAEAEKTENSEIEYKFSFKKGEEMSDEYVADFAKFAKEQGLSPEQAQAILSRNAAFYHNDRSRIDAELKAQAEEYEKEARAELGEHFDETVSYAAKALDKYDDDGALRKLFDALPVGNNVKLIKVFAKMGKDIAGDRLVKGGNAGDGKDIAHVLFPGFK